MTVRSTTWPELVKRYAEYRALPVWGTMVRVPDQIGRLRGDHIEAIAMRGKRAATRVSRALELFEKRCGTAWPSTPMDLIDFQDRFDRVRAKAHPNAEALRNFWDAMIFDRDGYSCRYCGRDAFDFYQESKGSRTLWLVVDHTDRKRKAPGKYEFKNSVTTCWTCNTVKGPLPEGAFLQELDSLVRSRLRLMPHSGP